ncbi:hypothetical protein KR044_005033, partial [Drosophila immigrans]
IMADYLGDNFYDCQSGSDSDVEDLGSNNCEQVIRAVGGFSPLDDPLVIRQALERVANNSLLLLRTVGGKCDYLGHLDRHTSSTFVYPATLEICARLLTDKSCACSPNCRCRLRGEPVTLQLPVELNPFSGQVNVQILQHGQKPLTVGGECHCGGAGDRRKS